MRIEGRVEKVSREVSEDYFSRRPRSSQAGATTSHQSAPVTRSSSIRATGGGLSWGSGDPIGCPEHWGGYRLVADRYEFLARPAGSDSPPDPLSTRRRRLAPFRTAALTVFVPSTGSMWRLKLAGHFALL